MGDKGGKKDKEKNKQQQVTKQKQDEQKKHDRAPDRVKPILGCVAATGSDQRIRDSRF